MLPICCWVFFFRFLLDAVYVFRFFPDIRTYMCDRLHVYAVCVCTCVRERGRECVLYDFGVCSQNVFEIEFELSWFSGGTFVHAVYICIWATAAAAAAAGKNHTTLFFAFIFTWSITLVRFVFPSLACMSWPLSCLKLLSQYLFDTVFFVGRWRGGNRKTKTNELGGQWIIRRRTNWLDLSTLFCSAYYMMSSAFCCRFRFVLAFPYIFFLLLVLFRLSQHLTAFMLVDSEEIKTWHMHTQWLAGKQAEAGKRSHIIHSDMRTYYAVCM